MLSTTVLSTSLGQFTLQADTTGLCGLLFPDEAASPVSTSPVDITTHPLLMETGRQLLAYLDGRLHTFDLPLSIHGTPFQQQVWMQLCAIPYGHTMTYGQLAERIGNRNKARAVGGAAHANPLGIIIPCHRLIGAKGRLTGFGGGLPMKQTLLNLEQRFLFSGTGKKGCPKAEATS
ncbi:methylated-DNA--[protein]-cysteine S-methyltransferase [Desulfobulbus oligotrophicus]|jgi:methylated-DNA-[protein]-cysteine S-methyltransferase|uniref:Methylated-DNA--protein-cysteine methyltransferase n=1 Tax=Desulfobulbus oligotrophicus TaxID=1909699 RepID=A0A7T6AQU3_9BACT|nr:methylated-DNA--[protein]-cysteine S-methyltransferase [Desulfobulbus oligotrophicus]MDY0390463.1 methylated-DNA--[protein]-cysteine S-methyltransferase [Desulfobulbus oligotrophicus]QQG65823.1 methylated-DNA--[protein]-cysteine S-methyltransferase [Desulfobulbus oligotrophicus]